MPDIIPTDMLMKADSDKELTGYVHPNTPNIIRAGIYFNGRLVGFMTPRMESIENQTWRTGAIYILPDYQGRGIGSKAISEFFKNRKAAPVPIGITNKASQKSFASAGFTTDGIIRVNEEDNNWKFQWWIKK
jgi:RimJ/RimL family protein N-acetyltransferase